MKKIGSQIVWFVVSLLVLGSLVNVASATVHPAGKNVVNNGTVYMITEEGQRRPYTSEGAFLSYGFNSWASVEQATPEDLALPEGAFIPPRDGKIVCSDRGSDKGTCYLITNGKRAAFISAKVFTDLGFSFAKSLKGDVSFLQSDTNIENATDPHRAGVLIKNGTTIYLISPTSLMGIPSMEVLATWGYSLNDVVNANEADKALAQSSVIQARQGAQLSPTQELSEAEEFILLKAYVDTHPELPTKTVSDPDSAAALLTFGLRFDKSENVSEVQSMLSSKSLELLSRIPKFKSFMDNQKLVILHKPTYTKTKVSVFEGSAVALFTATRHQKDTDFSEPTASVFVKESGIWKVDLIGSLKYLISLDEEENPTDDYVAGPGETDIGIVGLDFTADPKVNDPETKVLVALKNFGETTIHKFIVAVDVEDVETYGGTSAFTLEPGDSVIIEVPINNYWTIPVGNKNPGTYRALVSVGFLEDEDADLDDNSYYFEADLN